MKFNHILQTVEYHIIKYRTLEYKMAFFTLGD